MSTQFIHLRNHSEFSLVDGLLGIKPMVNRIRDLEMPAVALSDKNNFYGLVKFQKIAHNAGIKPIFGSDLIWFSDQDEGLESPFVITLLAQNQLGYKNLLKLISKAYQQGQTVHGASLRQSWIKAHSEGLIALSGGIEGDIGKALLSDKLPLADDRLQWWKDLFVDRFYLDLQQLNYQMLITKQNFIKTIHVNSSTLISLLDLSSMVGSVLK